MHIIEAVQWFPYVVTYPEWARDVLMTGHWEPTGGFTVTTPDNAEMTLHSGNWIIRVEETGEIRYESARRIELLYEPAGVSESGVQRFRLPDFALQSYPYDYVAVAKAACAKAGVEVVHVGTEAGWLVLTWQTPEGERSSRWDFDMTTPGTAFLMIYDEITGKGV